MVNISEIMKRNVITADPEINITAVARIMSNNKFGSVVISDIDNETPLGIVTWSRVMDVIAEGKDLNKTKAKNVMTKKLVTAKQDESILSVARKIVKHNVDRIPITESGKLVGIVSYKDILAATPELLQVLSEKLKATVMRPPQFNQNISGLCEQCGQYSDGLDNTDGRWVCETCID